jgi:isoleucyl-tRNA synthetase
VVHRVAFDLAHSGPSELEIKGDASPLEIQGDLSLQIKVERARGDKCERCWKYKTDVGSDDEFPTVCASCASVLPEFLS